MGVYLSCTWEKWGGNCCSYGLDASLCFSVLWKGKKRSCRSLSIPVNEGRTNIKSKATVHRSMKAMFFVWQQLCWAMQEIPPQQSRQNTLNLLCPFYQSLSFCSHLHQHSKTQPNPLLSSMFCFTWHQTHASVSIWMVTITSLPCAISVCPFYFQSPFFLPSPPFPQFNSVVFILISPPLPFIMT